VCVCVCVCVEKHRVFIVVCPSCRHDPLQRQEALQLDKNRLKNKKTAQRKADRKLRRIAQAADKEKEGNMDEFDVFREEEPDADAQAYLAAFRSKDGDVTSLQDNQEVVNAGLERDQKELE
jgi:hypothetical protein